MNTGQQHRDAARESADKAQDSLDRVQAAKSAAARKPFDRDTSADVAARAAREWKGAR